MGLVTRTLAAAARDLAHFGVLFMVVFVSFALMAFVNFGSSVTEFKDMWCVPPHCSIPASTPQHHISPRKRPATARPTEEAHDGTAPQPNPKHPKGDAFAALKLGAKQRRAHGRCCLDILFPMLL